MTISTDLDAWWADGTSWNQSNAAKAEFQTLMTAIDEGLNELERMSLAGEFSSLPPSVVTEFTWAWTQFDNVRTTALARTDFIEAIEWKP